MGKVLKDSQGNILLANGGAIEITSAIDPNIQAGNIKLGVNILGVTGTYGGGGGGGDAVILNPLNGSKIGTPTTSGIVTHQYQISGGTIASCFLTIPQISDIYISTRDTSTFPKYVSLKDKIGVSVDDNGLVTVNYNRSQSEVDDYNWEGNYTFGMCIVTDSGKFLGDSFSTYGDYLCIIKGTLISLENKEKKKIEDITYDDNLLVWNFDEGKYDVAKPIWIKKTQKTNWYYKLTFSDGNTLCVTGTYPEAHSLFSYEDGEFIHSNKLVGKKVYTLNGIQTLISCEEIHKDVEFYNIITNYHMNLFANDVLASTSLNNIYPISNMKFIKEEQNLSNVDYGFLDEKWIVGFRLKEQPKDVTEYCLNLISLTKPNK